MSDIIIEYYLHHAHYYLCVGDLVPEISVLVVIVAYGPFPILVVATISNLYHVCSCSCAITTFLGSDEFTTRDTFPSEVL